MVRPLKAMESLMKTPKDDNKDIPGFYDQPLVTAEVESIRIARSGAYGVPEQNFKIYPELSCRIIGLVIERLAELDREFERL
ncbi:MAG: hypothetical protein KBS67_05440 [Bacteroidales bacterium]|nr:hypothetical protein [Candidatus Cryptobacteroides equifaecalis]